MWANAGNAVNVVPGQRPEAFAEGFQQGLRASVGAGLVLGFMGQRVELNVAVPVKRYSAHSVLRLYCHSTFDTFLKS
jgi:hypothetical protein